MFKRTSLGFSSLKKGSPESSDKSLAITLRKKYKLTQETLAWLTCVSLHSVKMWESGRMKPSKAQSILLEMLLYGYPIPKQIRKKYERTFKAQRRKPRLNYKMTLDPVVNVMIQKGDGT